MIVKAFKLLRLRADGTLGPLFINRSQVIPIGRWLAAEDHPTRGYANRPGWHCCVKAEAPHLKTELASGEQRVWCSVDLIGVEEFSRPPSQGGTWYLAKKMRVKEIL